MAAPRTGLYADRLAGFEAQRNQPQRKKPHMLEVAAPRHLLPDAQVFLADGRRIAVGLRVVPELLGQGVAAAAGERGKGMRVHVVQAPR